MSISRSTWLDSDERFRQLYAENSEGLLIFFTRRVWDAQTAMDLSAETFAEAFLKRRRFRGEDLQTARSWLFGIGNFKLMHFLERGAAESRAIERLGLRVPALSEDDLERVEELASMGPLRAAVRESLAELSVEHQSALKLRVVDELPYPTVAEQLGVTEQAARARVSRGLRALAGALEDDGLTAKGLA